MMDIDSPIPFRPIYFPVRYHTVWPMDELPWRACESLAHEGTVIRWQGHDLRCPLCRAINEHEDEVERLQAEHDEELAHLQTRIGELQRDVSSLEADLDD